MKINENKITNTEELNKEIIRLLKADKYLDAIKFYKEQTNVSLNDAKDYVDSIVRRERLTHIRTWSERSSFWTKIFIGFIILNVLLVIAIIVGSNILNSLEYMDSLFGLSEWEVDEFIAKLSQERYLIPLIIALDIFLFVYLFAKSNGWKLKLKGYVIFIIILSAIFMPISYFQKIDKNRFKYEDKMEVIFNEIKDKRAFKNKKIEVRDLGFYVGNIDKQNSIYIVATFNNNRYTYRPYNLIMNWSKDNHQSSNFKSEYIDLDKLNVETVIPKIFKISENLIKEKNLSHILKGVGRVSLIYTTVKGKDDWYWRSYIDERGNRSMSTKTVTFDLDGNIVDLPSIFQTDVPDSQNNN